MIYSNSREMRNVNKEREKPLLLFFPFELLAHYLRCITLARQLAPFFEIRFAHSPRYQHFIEAEGFQSFHSPGPDADLVMACARKFDFSWMNTNTLKECLDHQVAAIKTLNPSAILGDTMPTLSMAAELTGVPYLNLQNGYMSRKYADVRKMSWRYPLYKYFQYLPNRFAEPLIKLGEQQAFHKIHQPFRRLRQQHGLLKKWYYPDELEGDLNLICDLPELFPQQSLPANYVIIPPLIFEPKAHTETNSTTPDPEKKTLFVSMGSSGDWQQVAFLNHPYFKKFNIITAGDTNNVVQGSNVTSMTFVNVKTIFNHVDLVICHGGNGTINQALQAGIPVLCKTAHFEQEWNVQALEKHGLGMSLDGLKTNAAYIEKVDAWMDKKGSEPFRWIQQRLSVGNDFSPVIERILNLVPAGSHYFPARQQRA
jgi:UDP:flavonoid glycosyltransferase YjiC (YdhE family)